MKKIVQMKNKKKLYTKGLSLIEVMIGVALMSIAVLALLSLYNTGQKYFVNQDIRADILNNSRLILTWLSRDIKEAVEVVPGPVDVCGSSYSTSTNCIVLRLPSVDSGGLIIDIENDTDYLVYRINPDNTTELQRIVDGKDGVSSRLDNNRILAGNIDSLALSYLGADGTAVTDYVESIIVDICLTVLRKGIQRTYQETLNTRMKLRNKIGL